MKIPFKKEKKITVSKEKRFNPHVFWLWYISIFVLVVIAELIFFSFYFINTTKTLDAQVQPNLETNASKIKSMQKAIDKIDEAIKGRVGENKKEVQTPTTTSQNTSPVVQ